MGIAEKLRQIWNIKAAIRGAIADKGVTIPESTPFADYPAKIADIQESGGEVPAGGNVTLYLNESGHVAGFGTLTLPPVTRIAERAFANAGFMQINFNDTIEQIDAFAFQYNSKYTQLNLPPNLKSIGNSAFLANNGITEVNIGFGNFPLTLGQRIFDSCLKITNVNIGPRVTYIGLYMFIGCTKLETVNIHANVEDIYTYAFQDCNKLTSISALGVKSVGGYAFSGCNLLQTVNLPSCTSLGTRTFNDCFELETVVLNDNMENMASSLFVACRKLKSLVLPSKVKYIQERLIYSCPEMRYLEIGPNVIQIINAPIVWNAEKLKAVVFKGVTPPTVSNKFTDYFQTVHADMKVYVPDSSVDAYKAMFITNAARFEPMSNFVMPDMT